MKHGMKTERACDFGAGIGRVADKLLLPVFKEVEMVEFSAKLCEQANKDFTAKGLIDRLKITCLPMQGWLSNLRKRAMHFSEYDTTLKFDLFWFQWCVGHLTDEDFIALFTRLRGKLSENGVIVIKDNCASTEETGSSKKKCFKQFVILEFDKDDSSVSRPVTELERLLKEAGLKVIEKEQQKNFPSIGLYPVYTLALRALE